LTHSLKAPGCAWLQPSSLYSDLLVSKFTFKFNLYRCISAAERGADRAIAAGKKNGDWRRGQVRALAVSLGAASAIKRGDSETALRFFAFAMRADPDTPLFKYPYKGIKSIQKALADADIKLDRGESRLAMDAADNAAATLRGLGADDAAGAMFAEIDSRRCRAHSQMRAFEHALGSCELAATAVGCPHVPSDAKEAEAKSTESKCAAADPRAYARVLMARAEVHSRDKYPEGAMHDLRTAQERIQPTAQRGSGEAGRLLREINQKLQEAEEEKHKHDNNRDHGKMLDLPENLGELPKDRRCDFIKKAYKRAALKWHPDKAMEAGKMRAVGLCSLNAVDP
jgi:tetratricopeptide (TPR) repeat protein